MTDEIALPRGNTEIPRRRYKTNVEDMNIISETASSIIVQTGRMK